jgi:fermentation-respiration switch protein FrsA (DUF1100 family)
MRELEFTIPGGAPVTGSCICLKAKARSRRAYVRRSGFAANRLLQPFERYFAPKGIAMLTLDMPSIGFSSKWKLTQDSSQLHQHALKHLKMSRGLTIRVWRHLVSALGRTLRCVWLILNPTPESRGLSWPGGSRVAQRACPAEQRTGDVP